MKGRTLKRRSHFLTGLALCLACVLAPAAEAPAQRGPAEARATEDVDDYPTFIQGNQGPRIAHAFGERFSGVWIDRRVTPNVYRVVVVNPTTVDEVALRSITANPLVVLSPGRASKTQFESWTRSAGEILQYTSEAGAAYVVSKQKVVVSGHSLSYDLVQKIRAAIPSELLEFEEGRTAALHATRFNYPPYEAGLYIVGSQTAISCTSGYVLRLDPDDGQRIATTAGHCMNHLFNQGIMGTGASAGVKSNTTWGRGTTTADIAYIPMTHDGDADPKVSVGVGVHRTVRGTLPDSELFEGRRLCFQGVASAAETGNTHCGDVTLAGVSRTFPYGGESHLIQRIDPAWCMASKPIEGDSGGPVYNVPSTGSANAAGWISHMYTSQLDDEADACFSSVDQAIRTFGGFFPVWQVTGP